MQADLGSSIIHIDLSRVLRQSIQSCLTSELEVDSSLVHASGGAESESDKVRPWLVHTLSPAVIMLSEKPGEWRHLTCPTLPSFHVSDEIVKSISTLDSSEMPNSALTRSADSN